MNSSIFNNRWIGIVLLCVGLMALFPCCQSMKPTAQPTDDVSMPTAENGILFVNLKISQDEKGTESVNLISKVWSDGKLKKPNNKIQEAKSNTLICQFLTKDKVIIKTVYLDNPLFSMSESFDPSGVIEREEQGLQEAPLMIRTEMTRNVAFVRVQSAQNESVHLIDLK